MREVQNVCHNMKCACCGGEMLHDKELENTIIFKCVSSKHKAIDSIESAEFPTIKRGKIIDTLISRSKSKRHPSWNGKGLRQRANSLHSSRSSIVDNLPSYWYYVLYRSYKHFDFQFLNDFVLCCQTTLTIISQFVYMNTLALNILGNCFSKSKKGDNRGQGGNTGRIMVVWFANE